jgi:serine/threonine-protein kinase
VKVLDFGIAKAASHTSTTLDGTLKGKLAYMSPEQCRGEPLDRRSDVFALGIVLYQLTAMSHPFGAKRGADNDLALLNRIISQEPPAPSKRRPEIPAELERIILKALEKDADKRYQTALAVLEDIESFALDNRIAISPVNLRRFMHEHFSDKIGAWREAEGKGISLAEHVVSEREKQGTPSSGILSADNLAKLREAIPQPDDGIPASEDIVPGLHDTIPQLTLRRGIGKWPKLVAGALVVAAVVTFLVWPREDAAAPADEVVPIETAEPAPAKERAPSATPPPVTAAAAPTAKEPEPVEKVTIRLTLDPPDAKIELDGIAFTGTVLELPKSDHVFKLVVSASGYSSETRDLRAVVDGALDIKLDKKRKAPRRSKPKGYVGPMETDL